MAHKSLDSVARAFKTIRIESSSSTELSIISQRQAQAVQLNFGLVIINLDQI